MAIDCLGSLVRLCAESVRLQIHDDGSLSNESVDLLLRSLPVERLVRRKEADQVMEEFLSNYPGLFAWRHELVLSLKLLDGPVMTQGENYHFVDTDVLFLGRFGFPSQRPSVLLMRDRASSYSFRSFNKLFSPVVLPSRANSGIILARKEVVDFDYLEWFVTRSRHRSIPSMVEQTAWAALGMRSGCEIFCEDQVRVFREGEDISALLAGHFTARSRHHLAEFVARSTKADQEAVPRILKSESSGVCRATDLFGYECRRLWGKFWPGA